MMGLSCVVMRLVIWCFVEKILLVVFFLDSRLRGNDGVGLVYFINIYYYLSLFGVLGWGLVFDCLLIHLGGVFGVRGLAGIISADSMYGILVGRSFAPTGVAANLLMMSIPFIVWPKEVYWPSRNFVPFLERQMKN